MNPGRWKTKNRQNLTPDPQPPKMSAAQTGNFTEREIFSRWKRSALILIGGNGLASVLGFVSLAINARAMGPELLGILALLQAFVAIVSKFFSFDTWQPVLKFGAEAQAAKDNARLRDVLVLGFVYDLAGAIAATLVGLAVVGFGLPLIGIDWQHQIFAAVFAVTLLFGATSSATGLLRLFNKFEWIATLQIGISFAAVIIAVSLWWVRAPFAAYVVAYAALSVLQSCAIIIIAIALWRRYQLPTLLSPRFDDRELRSAFWRFSWSTSALSSINVLRQNADALVIAALLGPAATGLYKVASQIASIITRIGDPLQQAFFPEIAGLIAKGDLGRLRRILVLAFLGGLVLLAVFIAGAVIVGETAVRIVGGTDYGDAAAPLLWLAISHGLSVAGFYIRPAVVTLIGPAFHFVTYLVATAAFVPSLYFGISSLGIAGAGLSQVAFTIVWFVLNGAILAHRLSFRRGDLGSILRTLISATIRPLKAPLTRMRGRRRLYGRTRVLAEVAQEGRHVWAGYYDLPVISPDGQRITYHALEPGANEVEFGVFDLRSRVFDVISITRSWSFQFGTRLQFLSDDVVMHYEETDGKVATYFRSLSDGKAFRRLEGLGCYSTSASRSFMTAINYPHIRKHRPGYGFAYSTTDADAALTLHDLRTPDAKCLWRLDLSECADLARHSTGDDSIREDAVHLNCPAFSCDEEKVAFVVASFGVKRRQHLYISQWRNPGMLACPLVSASHFCWTGIEEISVFGQDISGTSRYWFWNLRTNKLLPMGKPWPRVDGHQSRHPTRDDTWLTDSYPNRLAYQSLYVINGNQRRQVADLFAPLGMAFDKCDLHPRWSPQGRYIVIDTAYSGLRRSLVLDVGCTSV